MKTLLIALAACLLLGACASPQACGDRDVVTSSGGSSSEARTAVNVGGLIDLLARIANGGCTKRLGED